MLEGIEPSVDNLWDKIVSIEPLGSQRVYDIEVEGTDNFVANGIVAHNTYTGDQRTDGRKQMTEGQTASPAAGQKGYTRREAIKAGLTMAAGLAAFGLGRSLIESSQDETTSSSAITESSPRGRKKAEKEYKETYSALSGKIKEY